jgi:mitochondrial fission protein ELM1
VALSAADLPDGTAPSQIGRNNAVDSPDGGAAAPRNGDMRVAEGNIPNAEFGAETKPFNPRTWVITNGNQGSDAQAEGLVRALGLTDVTWFPVKMGAPFSWFAPGGSAPWGHVGNHGKVMSPPWPDMVISVGRHAAPYAHAVRQKSKGETFAVALQHPRTKLTRWDMVWAPEHDGLTGENVVTTLTSPHRLTPESLSDAGAAMHPEIAAMPRPWIAVLIGGPNKAFRFPARIARDLCDQLDALAPNGSFLITTSRRTPEAVGWTIKQWMGTKPARLWMGGAANPYLGFLGLADAVVVTADSVNMAGEAASTGKPVYVFELPTRPMSGGGKFRNFHQALAKAGATRALSGAKFEPWAYPPVNPNPTIAAALKRAYWAWAGT